MTTIHNGDCIQVMNAMPPESVDAIVTDPPYGLGFMGRKWDSLPPSLEWAEACMRVLKPGGHIVAFGGTRTWHRLAVAIEDAGFEMRDSLAWLYGSGFPKSLDVSKAIDKRRDWTLVERLSGEIRRARAEAGLSLAEIGQATLAATDGTYGKWYHRGGYKFFETGRSLPSRPEWEQLRHVLPIAPEFAEVYDEAEREVLRETTTNRDGGSWAEQGAPGMFQTGERTIRVTAPATPEAAQWDGWGTALKPAFEPIVLARKPLAEKTVARNVLEHGTGAINVDACRIEATDDRKPVTGFAARTAANRAAMPNDRPHMLAKDPSESQAVQPHPSGRWPANVLLDQHAAAWVDEQSGVLKSGALKPYQQANREHYSGSFPEVREVNTPANEGGASRFFYSAKAPKLERPNVDGVQHPTVKPLAIMRWLIRLVTPPGGVVLDPFAGSGTTIEAALMEGFNPVGIEMEADYLPLIQHRIDRQAGTLTA